MNASCFQNWQSNEINFDLPYPSSIRRIATANTLAFLLCLTVTSPVTRAQDTQNNQGPSDNLKKLSLEQLGNVEVTTISKDPQQVQKTPAAVFVITQEDIRRSGGGIL